MRKSANASIEIWNNKDLESGETISGYYIREQKFTSKQYGECVNYIVKVGDKEIGIRGSAVVKRCFEQIPVGAHIWATYNGLVKSKNGRDVRDYSIDYDDADILAS